MSKTAFAVVVSAVCLTSSLTNARLSAQEPDTGRSVVRVSLQGGAPGEQASVLLYELDYRDQGEVIARKDAKNGACEFASLKRGSYILLARTATRMAAQDLYIEDEQTVPIHLELQKPVRPEVTILDPAGRPLPGVELQSVEVQGANGSLRLQPGHARRLGLPWDSADDAGKLRLPPLPDGANLKVTASHPDYPLLAAEGLVAREGALEALRFEPGVPMEFTFEAVGDVPLPEEVRLYLLPAKGTSGTELRSVPFALDAQRRARVMVKPGEYRWFQFDVSQEGDYLIAPFHLLNVEVSDAQPWRLACRVHPRVEVAGRILDARGEPFAEASVRTEVAMPPDHEEPWSHAAWAESDADGNYTIRTAPGTSRISIQSKGHTGHQQEIQIVAGMRLPDVVLEPLPPVTGIVRDEQGTPLADCAVLITGQLRPAPHVVSDAQGRFELKPNYIPFDAETGAETPDCHVLAIHPQQSLQGSAPARIGDKTRSTDLEIVLRAGPPDEPVSRPDDLLPAEKPGYRGTERTLLIGKPAPELDCLAWINGERVHYTLDDFRGKYVLIDLWATWCGPCHYDFPKVTWLHEQYADHGLVVIALHDNSVPLESIRAHVAHEKLNFLVAVDQPDGRTVDRYKAAGMEGYPSYLLIDPRGIVVEMSNVLGRPNLRRRLLTVVRSHLLQGNSPSHTTNSGDAK